MKVIARSEYIALVRFDRGEDVLAGLTEYCQANKIGAASFVGLGAAEQVELAFYDLEKKEYLATAFDETLEIAGLTGNVAGGGDDIIIHAHGVFSDREMKPVAGHVNKLIAAGTCEVTLTILPGKMVREIDEATGLKLLK